LFQFPGSNDVRIVVEKGGAVAFKLEYHDGVKKLNGATVARFGLVVSAVFFSVVFLTVSAKAQINGTPASVTSTGFGGVPGSIHGVAPSVTSLGPQGYTPRFQPFPTNNGFFGVTSNYNLNGRNGHHRGRPNYYGWGGGYSVPYYGYYDNGDYAGDPPPPDDQYSGGPTIFDRRGPGAPARYPANNAATAPGDNMTDADADTVPPPPAADQPRTLLVFKDGHQLEVENYAIIGNTLYNLSDGHRQKIALADLDLTATAKQNDDRGVDFELPGTTQAN
jgi:hypothetical protein